MPSHPLRASAITLLLSTAMLGGCGAPPDLAGALAPTAGEKVRAKWSPGLQDAMNMVQGTIDRLPALQANLTATQAGGIDQFHPAAVSVIGYVEGRLDTLSTLSARYPNDPYIANVSQSARMLKGELDNNKGNIQACWRMGSTDPNYPNRFRWMTVYMQRYLTTATEGLRNIRSMAP